MSAPAVSSTPHRRRSAQQWVPSSLLIGKFLLAAVLGVLFLAGCAITPATGHSAATIVGRGVVNNPKNKSLRFDMIKFGLKSFCAELLERGAPLRLTDGQPVIGRYFGEKCEARSIDTLDRNTVVVQFSGRGYAWTAGTGRLGFRAAGLLELAPDFRIHADAMYVYFRPQQVDTSAFHLIMTEHPLAEIAAQVAGIDEEKLGQSIVNAQLGQGFTAIRYNADGLSEFALGLVAPGDTPFLPFQVVSSPRITLANGRTELFAGQQDFIGKLRVGNGDVLTLTFQVAGTEAIDFALLSEKSASPHLERYLSQPGAPPLSVTPSFLSQASSAAKTRAQVRLPAGEYYLILDHSNAWGKTTPEKGALPARVDYLIQKGSADLE